MSTDNKPSPSPTLAQACEAAARNMLEEDRRAYEAAGMDWCHTDDDVRYIAAGIIKQVAPVVEQVVRERGEWRERYEALASASVGTKETFKSVLEERDTLRADLARTQAKLEEVNERVKVEQSCVAKEAAKVTDLRARLESAQQMLTAGLESAQDKERLDWLDAQTAALNERFETTYGWRYDFNHNRTSLSLTDCNLPALPIRAAIDQARGRKEGT